MRVRPDNDLILDLESVVVNGQRYAIRTESNRVQSQRDNSIVGSIVGAISGGQAQGRAVRIPRNSVLTFRLERPLDMGVADRGVTETGAIITIITARNGIGISSAVKLQGRSEGRPWAAFPQILSRI